MSDSSPRRLRRLRLRRPGSVTERDWDRSELLEPRPAPRDPELVSDGAGLPFALAVLDQPLMELDPGDPAVAALSTMLARSHKKSGEHTEPLVAPTLLAGWRLAARSDNEALFALGRPPRLITVSVRPDSTKRKWACVSINRDRPLRATRDGVRASSWRIDPTQELDLPRRELRVLVTEQTWAGGKRADTRLQAPDLHVSADDLVLTMFVTPRHGFQVRSENPETPARIALPEPVGSRQLIDGALYGVMPSEPPPSSA